MVTVLVRKLQNFILMITLICFPLVASAATPWNDVANCPSDPNRLEPACMIPVRGVADAEAIKWRVGFDYDRDGCLPSAAVSPQGMPNPGIKTTGSLDGHCAWRDQLSYANTYHRSLCVSEEASGDGNRYCVHMYAQYFVKDQAAFGHTNDWEHALVWIKNGNLTDASYSAHGGGRTQPIGEIFHNGNMAYIVYHKDGAGTHAMRFADSSDTKLQENPRAQWVTPSLVSWDSLKNMANGPAIQNILNTHNWGKAVVPFKQSTFVDTIAGLLPVGYPPKEKWQQAFDPNATDIRCASEHEICRFSGVKLVTYGANRSYYSKIAKDSIPCDNSAFGDPLVGVVKICSYTNTPVQWKFCAVEHNLCVVPAGTIVRYGAGNVFNYQKTTSNNIVCDNNKFGDPLVGAVKSCEFATVDSK